MRKTTKEEFIKRAKKIHGDKYDYSKVKYVDTHTKVCIVCPNHGEFWQTPHEHLKYKGCKKCADDARKTPLEVFINASKQTHGDKYDYSKANYINTFTKVCIICSKHGEFWQTPDVHLRGCGCPICGKEKPNRVRTTLKEFIKKAKEVHGNKYDYSKVEYKGSKERVCIICPKHGEFWQTPYSHISGHGCKYCSNKHKGDRVRQHDTDWFIKKAKEVHGDKYDYTKSEYKAINRKLCIICPEHGEFWQTPANHIWSKNGCDRCGGTYRLDTKGFLERAQEIHGKKYNYTKVDYVNSKTKVCIICPEHGEFWQTPNGHLLGQGCPRCKSSHLERDIRLFLEDKNIKFIEQKTFPWLKLKKQQYLDFYLPDYNIGIECQGEQHFQRSGWGKGGNWERVYKRDLNKLNLCEKHGVRILYYSDLGINYPYHVYEDKNLLLEGIKIQGNCASS